MRLWQEFKEWLGDRPSHKYFLAFFIAGIITALKIAFMNSLLPIIQLFSWNNASNNNQLPVECDGISEFGLSAACESYNQFSELCPDTELVIPLNIDLNTLCQQKGEFDLENTLIRMITESSKLYSSSYLQAFSKGGLYEEIGKNACRIKNSCSLSLCETMKENAPQIRSCITSNINTFFKRDYNINKNNNMLLIFLTLLIGWGIYKISFSNLNYYRGLRIARDTDEPILVVPANLDINADNDEDEDLPNAEAVEEEIVEALEFR